MAFLLNALGIGPAQQAQTQQAQQNYAQGVNQDALQQAQQQQQQQLANMMLRYQAYMGSNPSPAQTWKPITGPQQNTGNVGGGTIPSSGSGMMGVPQQGPSPPPQMPQMPRNGGVPAANAAQQQSPQNLAAILASLGGSSGPPRFLQGNQYQGVS